MKDPRLLSRLMTLLGMLALAAPVPAQHLEDDPPMTYLPMQAEKQEDVSDSAFMNALKAISWYLPNRIADLMDIPQAYVTLGDGMGATVRATKLFYFSWYDTEAWGIGWGGRKQARNLFFGENVNEQYLGFLAAQQGDIDRDPTEVGLSLHLWALGANFALSGAEFVDGLAGIVGIDLMNDDHGPMLFDFTSDGDAPEASMQEDAGHVSE